MRRPMRATRALLLLALAFCLSGCDALHKQLDQWVPEVKAKDKQLYAQTKAGRALFVAKKYDQALSLFLKLQSQHPKELSIRYNLGAIHLRLGEAAKGKQRKKHFKLAERYLEQTLAKGSAKVRQKAHYNLGVLYTHKRQYSKGLYHFEQSVYLAKKQLKIEDKDAESNRSLLAMLLRQRNRQRRKLNRTRVFRYEAKVIQLRASKAYPKPLLDIALKGTFTHVGTGIKREVWGYPISNRRWQVRFIPTRTGKWRYQIRSLVQAIPGSKKKTQLDRSLRDSGLFRVMPSARAGRLIIASANGTRLAWKKSKTQLKLKQKKKGTAPQPKTKGTKAAPPHKQSKAPKAKSSLTKGRPKAKGKKELPKDEKIIRWHGVKLPGLFSSKLKDKAFGAQLKLLQQIGPSALHVPLDLDRLFALPKAANKAPKLAARQWLLLTRRLKALRGHPSDRWALVYELKARKKWSPLQLELALPYLIARLGHVDALWSTSGLSPKLAAQARKLLLKYDAYKQPIASRSLPASFKAQVAARKRAQLKRFKAMLARRRKQLAQQKTKKAQPKSAKGQAGPPAPRKGKGPKKPAPLPKVPPLQNTRFVLHTSHHQCTTPKALQQPLRTPWIGALPVPLGLSSKALLRLWWRLYISGVQVSITLDRTFHPDEAKEIADWLTKASNSDVLPPHPSELKASPNKKANAPTQGTSSKKKANPNKKASAAQKKQPKAQTGPPLPRAKKKAKSAKQPKKKAKAPKTPIAKRISRPFLHYLRVRHRWFKFLNSFRFTGLVKPMMVRVRMPDFAAFRAALTKWQKAQAAGKKAKAPAPGAPVKRRPATGAPAKKAPKAPAPRKAAPKAPSRRASAKKAPARRGPAKRGPARRGPARKVAAAPRPKASSSRPAARRGPPASRPAIRKLDLKKLLAKRAKRPSMKWKNVGMRGYLAGNVTTVLFLAPPKRAKKSAKAPQIRWKNRRMDMEFAWYNARTGKFLKKVLFHQVTSLALAAPKKEAHIAKVVIKDHPLHTPYKVLLPVRLAPVKAGASWRSREWQLLVTPPKGPKQRLAVLLGRSGYFARFRPDAPGFWRFTLLRKGKRLKGAWGYDGLVKAVPAQNPMPMFRHPRLARRFLVGAPPRRVVPALLFAQPARSMLSSWSKPEFASTLEALPKQRPASNLLIARLPKVPWKGFDQSLPKEKMGPSPPTSRKVVKQLDQGARRRFLQAMDRLESRIAAIHKSKRLLALELSDADWRALPARLRRARMLYLLDRFASAYPLLWIVDRRGALPPKGKKKAPKAQLARLIKLWYAIRYPHPAMGIKDPKKRRKAARIAPSAWPPLVGVALGTLRSQKQLKQTKGYDFLWLTVANLGKDLKDFGLDKESRPVFLSWKTLQEPGFGWKKGKSGWDQKRLGAWASFLWRSQLMGFSHVGRPLGHPLFVDEKKGKKKKAPKLEPPHRIPAVLHAFFGSFNWLHLGRPLRSIKLKDFQAFGAETRFNPKAPEHHVVAWVHASVRQKLLLQQKAKLKKHRYMWLNPLTGARPVSPQLLPLPAKGKPNRLQVPFRPAILYVFKRRPRKQRRRRKQNKRRKQNRKMSKRQQVRNRLRNMRENRNKMLKKMLGKPKNFSGKRG